MFGFGAPSQAALNYVNVTAVSVERAEEFVASAFVSGDSSQLFSLPGGPVQFALGAEYRSETASSSFDDLTASGGTFLNAIQPFTPPKFTVKDAFGEIRIPLLKDKPFVELLSIEGAQGAFLITTMRRARLRRITSARSTLRFPIFASARTTRHRYAHRR